MRQYFCLSVPSRRGLPYRYGLRDKLRAACPPCQTAGRLGDEMFKFVWLVGVAWLMEHYGVPPLLFALILAGIVLGFVVDLERRVGHRDTSQKRVDATARELSDIQRD